MRTRARLAVLALAAIAPAACGTSRAGPARPAHVASARHRAEAAKLLIWAGRHHVRGVVDLSAPRADGSIVVAAAGKLQLLAPGGGLSPFAPRYAAPPGLEPYVALPSAQRVSDAGCRFPADSVYALRLNHGDGVTVVDAGGRVRRFARLSPRGLENGITFDETGPLRPPTARDLHRLGRDHGVRHRLPGTRPRPDPRCAEGGRRDRRGTTGVRSLRGRSHRPGEVAGTIYAITPAGSGECRRGSRACPTGRTSESKAKDSSPHASRTRWLPTGGHPATATPATI